MRYRQNIETCHLFNANIQSAFVVVTQKKLKNTDCFKDNSVTKCSHIYLMTLILGDNMWKTKGKKVVPSHH